LAQPILSGIRISDDTVGIHKRKLTSAGRRRSTLNKRGAEMAGTVRAVDRAIAVLQCFTAAEPAMSVLEIQRRVGLSRPTLYRLLQTLAAKGLISAEGDPQRFRLGHGVMQLAHVWLSGLNIIDIARPIVEELREKTGETAALFVMGEEMRICALELTSHHMLSVSHSVGHRMDLTVGATGKAILAFLDENRRAAILNRIISREKRADLVKDLETVRSTGYATSRGEVFAGGVAVAAPVFDHNGEVAGSIGVFGPTARVSEDHLATFAKLVVEAAATLSTQLGFRFATAERSKQDAELKSERKHRRAV
jgi:DNA-binding IclR family transcriptional regulator